MGGLEQELVVQEKATMDGLFWVEDCRGEESARLWGECKGLPSSPTDPFCTATLSIVLHRQPQCLDQSALQITPLHEMLLGGGQACLFRR